MCHDQSPHPVRGGDAIEDVEIAIPLISGSLPAFLALPDQRPAPAILVIHDINGPNEFYRDLTRRLALAGYVAALPDFFFRQGPLADTSGEAKSARMHAMEQSKTMADIQTALLWLQHHEGSTGVAGTIGFCMGGTLVMLASTRDPAPAASVAFYGFPNRQRTPTAPILPSDEDEASNLQSPLLALWGTDDKGVGMENVDRYEAQLERYGKDHEFVRYPGIGHGFLTFDPEAATFDASGDAWSRTLAFLDARLKQAGHS